MAIKKFKVLIYTLFWYTFTQHADGVRVKSNMRLSQTHHSKSDNIDIHSYFIVLQSKYVSPDYPYTQQQQSSHMTIHLVIRRADRKAVLTSAQPHTDGVWKMLRLGVEAASDMGHNEKQLPKYHIS